MAVTILGSNSRAHHEVLGRAAKSLEEQRSQRRGAKSSEEQRSHLRAAKSSEEQQSHLKSSEVIQEQQPPTNIHHTMCNSYTFYLTF